MNPTPIYDPEPPDPISYEPTARSFVRALLVDNGRALPVAYGLTRISGTVIWQGAPVADGGGDTTEYVMAVAIGLCEGTVTGIRRVWIDDEELYNTPRVPGVPVDWRDNPHTKPRAGFELHNGDWPQTKASMLTSLSGAKLGTWSEAPSYHWSGTAYVCHSSFWLKDKKTLPSAMSFEVEGLFMDPTSLGASPADVLNDLLTHSRRGLGIDATKIDAESLTAYRAYCAAAGIWMNWLLDTQSSALEHLKTLLIATNADLYWSWNATGTAGAFKIVVLADQPVIDLQGNVVWSPPTVAQYDLSPDDFKPPPGEDPVRVEQLADIDTFNSWPVEYVDRSMGYVTNLVAEDDFVDVRQYGLNRAPTTSLHCIGDVSTAQFISRLIAQRTTRCRNEYRFRLDWRHARLERGDIVTLTDTVFGLDHVPVRITAIDADADGLLEVTARDWPVGVSSAALWGTQSGDGSGPQLWPETVVPDTRAREVANKTRVFYQNDPPAGGVYVTGDLWIDTNDQNRLYMWSGSTWVEVRDGKIGTIETLASSKSAVFYSALAPSNPTSGYTLRTGDVWFSTDTTTSCPDSSCKGHTADATGDPQVGTYPHRALYWSHRWSGTAWVDARATQTIITSELAAGVIVASKIATDSLRTTTYSPGTSGGSEYAITGVKIQNPGGSGGSLLVGNGQFRLGTAWYDSDGARARIWQAMRSDSNNLPFYAGCADGVPDITNLYVFTRGSGWLSDSVLVAGFRFAVANHYNADSLKQLRLEVYRSVQLDMRGTLFVPMVDRARYNDADVNVDFAAIFDPSWSIGRSVNGGPAAILRCTLYNAFGASASRDYNVTYTGQATVTTALGDPPGSGGGTGGTCPAPWVKILLANGRSVEAGDLVDGARVAGFDETTMAARVGVVRSPRIVWDDRVDIVLADGATTAFSALHRLVVEGRGWVEVRHLRPGDVLLGCAGERVISAVHPTGRAQVVTFRVDDSKTYYADGIASHNTKSLP